MRHRHLRALATAGTAVLATTGAGPVSAAPAGTGAGEGGAITVVELPRFERGYTIVADVNERGRAAGHATVPLEVDPRGQVSHVVTWQDGAMTDLMPTPLPTPGMPNGPTGTAAAIADDGRVAGTVSSGALPTGEATSDAVTWHDGEAVNLSAASPTVDVAVDANARGQVLYNEDGRAVVWRDGRYVRSPLVGGTTMAGVDINAAGLVVGTSGHPDGADPTRAYAWSPGSPPVDLGTLGGPSSVALAVNDRGQALVDSTTATGDRRQFLWHRGRATDLGTLGGAEAFAGIEGSGPWGSTRNLLNDRGDVVGMSQTASGAEHGFLWSDGRMVDLDAPGTQSVPAAVNGRRQVVGTARDPGTGFRPFLWQDGDRVGLFDAAPPPTPASYGGATLIDDRGDVFGFSWYPFEAIGLRWHAPPG